DRVNETPARRDVGLRLGRVTSIGLHGATSRPCSQPAVCPENNPPRGSLTFSSRTSGISSCTRSWSDPKKCAAKGIYRPKTREIHPLSAHSVARAQSGTLPAPLFLKSLQLLGFKTFA